jgi:hypothetical protein
MDVQVEAATCRLEAWKEDGAGINRGESAHHQAHTDRYIPAFKSTVKYGSLEWLLLFG